MPKVDCKYWDKCYQRNEQHLLKYNHPKKEETNTDGSTSKTNENVKANKAALTKATATTSNEGQQQQQEQEKQENKAPKKMSTSTDEQNETTKENTNTESNGTTIKDASTHREEIDTADLRHEALGNIAGKDYMELLHKRIKLSVQTEYDELLRTNEFIRHKFLVEMPPDFYAFWKFICELKPNLNGQGDQVLDYIDKQFQLQLVGPFEFLAGRFHKAIIREPGDYLRHWRFFYDPPEFQTVFVRRGTGVHYGYWRDTPQDKDALLMARNDASKSCEFEFIGGNIFEAFLYYLDKDHVSTPFTAATIASTKKSVHKFIADNEVKLEQLETLRKSRNKKVLAKTFHRAGIVVPYEAKTQLGYRPLSVSDAELKKILSFFEKAGSDDKDDSVRTAVIVKLQPIATAASIALDECDFGTSLELGIDLFCSGRLELHMLVQSLLVPAYTLLKRPQFIAISKAHMEKRSKGLNLSIFELDKK